MDEHTTRSFIYYVRPLSVAKKKEKKKKKRNLTGIDVFLLIQKKEEKKWLLTEKQMEYVRETGLHHLSEIEMQ